MRLDISPIVCTRLTPNVTWGGWRRVVFHAVSTTVHVYSSGWCIVFDDKIG